MATIAQRLGARTRPWLEISAYSTIAIGIGAGAALVVAGSGVDLTQLEGAPAWVWPLFLLMACSPTIAALCVRLIFHGTPRGFATGWRLPRPGALALAAAVPAAYALAAHLALWLTGLAPFSPAAFLDEAQGVLGAGWAPAPVVGILYALLVLGGGTLAMALFALGEEIGYNGYLIPTLAAHVGLARAAMLSGLIWVACHIAPITLFTNYGYGAPLWYTLAGSVLCFQAASFIYARLRVATGSLWPAVIAHAGHNVWIHFLLVPITATTPAAAYLTGDHGALIFLAAAAVAALLWRRGKHAG